MKYGNTNQSLAKFDHLDGIRGVVEEYACEAHRSVEVSSRNRRIISALLESEKRFIGLAEQQKAIFNTLPQLVSFVDRDLVYRFVNRAYETFFNCKGEDIVGRSVSEVIGVSAWKKSEAHARRVLAGESVDYLETFEYPGKRLTHIMGHLLPRYDDTGMVDGYFAFLTDVSSLELIKNELQHTQKAFRELAEGTEAILWEFDVVEDRWSYVAPQAERITGYRPEEWTNLQFWMDRVHPDDRAWAVKYCADCTARGVAHEFEYRFVKKDGTAFWVRDVVNVKMCDGAPVKMRGFMFDIQTRKQTELDLRKNQELLHRTNRLAKVGGWELDVDNLSLIWTDEVYRIHEVPADFQPTIEAALTFYAPAARPVIERALQAAIERRIPFDLELPMVTASGKEIWVRTIGRPAADSDSNRRLAGVIQDISGLKQTEDELRASQQRYALAQRMTGLGTWEWNVATDDLFWSDEVFKVLHITPGQFKPTVKNLLERLVPEDRNRYLEGVKRCLKTGTLLDIEYRIVGEDHQIYWVHALGNVTYDRSRNIEKMIGVVEDITERRRTEEILEQRLVALTRPLENPADVTFEDLFNIKDVQRMQDKFAEATGVGSIITDLDGLPITRPSNFRRLCREFIRPTKKGLANCQMSDAVICSMNGEGPVIQNCLSAGLWDAGTAITVGGRRIANWLIGQVRDESLTEEQIRRYAREIGADEEGMATAFHEVPVMPRGQFEKIAQALHTMANQLSAVAYQNVQQARFIFERKEAEKSLLESEMKFRSYVEAAPDGILVLDEKGCFLEVNLAATRTTGFSRDELIGMYFINLVVPDDHGTLQKSIDEAWDTGQTEAELRFSRKDGKNGWMAIDAVRISENRILCFTRDITGNKQIEERMRQVGKMDAIGQLAGGVAHDYNNMLSVILGHSEMAMMAAGTDSPLHEHLEQILTAARHSTEITRQLLTFARKQAIAPKILDLNDTVESVLKMLRRLIGEDIILSWSPGAKLWPTRIDPTQVDQILANLCVNARDAIAGVGRVAIETQNIVFEQGDSIDHSRPVSGEFVLLTISDNGIGMDEEIQNNIFEPFFTTKDVGQGTGLGLATVYGIVKQNNGFINVYSEPGEGTIFKIYLPRHKGNDTCSDNEQAEDIPSAQGECILLVEDALPLLALARRMLEMLGYTVYSTTTPGEALKIAELHKDRIDLLMTDVVMPEMNGRELAETLRARGHDLHILFMSGYTADVIAHRGVLEEGINFIQKPFSRKVLALKIREVLDGRRANH